MSNPDTAQPNKMNKTFTSATHYYSLDSFSEDKSRAESDASVGSKRKHTQISSMPTSEPQGNVQNNSATASQEKSDAKERNSPQTITTRFVPDPPDWEQHSNAWAYLQSLHPSYQSGYLDRQSADASGRTGYLLGRRSNCDFVYAILDICIFSCLSLKYCRFETGTDGQRKGICIYLEDLSFNGTFVNGKLVGRGRRVLLRSGDRVQLYRRDSLAENDIRHLFYRVVLPTQFEVSTFREDHIVGKILGKGNFAAVYEAERKSNGKKVAVKVISKSRFGRKPKLLPSIIEEIGILMSLDAHPGVIQVEKVFNEPKYIYVVLEYAKGGELFDRIVDRKHLSEAETRFVFWQLFSAIQFLHSRGIIHRDLKPENVLLANEGSLHVKITDFGLAKFHRGENSLGSQCGTPNYVAPEILDPAGTRAYGKACDLWSLGVIMYICLCGFPPFNEELGPPPMKQQIREGIYDFPSPYWDNISSEAKELVRGLLTVNPKDRLSVEQALAHEWMKMDKESMDAMRATLDQNMVNAISRHDEEPISTLLPSATWELDDFSIDD
ncbi:hypothetical protein EC973_007769 [Apophysomyces ossiformis]|uniref:Pkinase-domain-containing protein n=1 Tax=Apophysomyces ossiformis TaxID=679940 RepID=A0A8H7ESY7_9FUNG|nr:hypothetical protein EC973_007769 [Apophysomyces ossiformis]